MVSVVRLVTGIEPATMVNGSVFSVAAASAALEVSVPAGAFTGNAFDAGLRDCGSCEGCHYDDCDCLCFHIFVFGCLLSSQYSPGNGPAIFSIHRVD